MIAGWLIAFGIDADGGLPGKARPAAGRHAMPRCLHAESV